MPGLSFCPERKKMKNKIKRVFSLLLVLVAMLSVVSLTAFALEWDGNSVEGGSATINAGPNGYAIATDTWENCVGYRFSLVNKSGENKVSKVIDVFRDSHFGRHGYGGYKFTVKYNKKQLIGLQNSGFSTSNNTTNCYKEKDYSFATGLPDPSGMADWQNNTTNLNMVLNLLGAGNISMLKNGDKIIVEPLFDVRLESIYHALTVTETALYGKHILGADSNGGASSQSESWGFISNFVNKHYPNSLFTPDGQGLWTGVSASSSRIKFKDIINKGYGVGIAYTETKSDFSPVLSVKECRAYKGAKSVKTYHYGTSTGNAFAYWTYVTDYPKSGDKISFSVNFPKETENCYVKQTVWIDGVQIDTRKGYSNNLEWFDFAASSNTVPASKSYYTVKARVDWIETNGTVKKTGAEKSFYIPVKPIVTREKVTAFNELGNAQAYSTGALPTGKLYFGQKVTFQYQYGATTTWESSNNVRGRAYRWDGSNWSGIYPNDDVNEKNVTLSSTKFHNKNSSIGSYVIPLNAKEDTYSYRLRFDLKTAWSRDTAHTEQSDTFYLPIIKPDVAIVNIKLVDSDGYYADLDELIVGQSYTIRYVYLNNTDCTVFVKGYDDGGSRIPGVYSIPAYETIEIDGETHVVPEESDYTIWGGVYLSTVDRGNTDYETDGTNNEMTISCHTLPQMAITSVAPNASYRESTKVISTFRVWNYTERDILPDDNVTVTIRVYKPEATTPFYTASKNVVIPAIGSNVVYFKWTVPSGLNGGNVRVDAELYNAGASIEKVSDLRQTTPYYVYTTPDTRYEENAPSGFGVPSKPTGSTGAASWWIYEYKNGSLVKKTYMVSLLESAPNKIEPATGETSFKTDGVWTMKSGYGISLQSRILINSLYGNNTASVSSYTLPQYAYALFPEYNYVFADGKAVTLNKVEGEAYTYFEFPALSTYGKVHFTPLWYPDGNYTVKIVQSDCWTPAGMISLGIVPDSITISGNAYDDWYAGRR